MCVSSVSESQMKGQEYPEAIRQQDWPSSPRVTGTRVLTTVLLVAVV